MSSTCSKTQYAHLNGPYMLEKPTNLKPRKGLHCIFPSPDFYIKIILIASPSIITKKEKKPSSSKLIL